MYDVDTRDKHKPHYGMNNLNSRQEKEKKNSTTKKRKQEKQLDDILKIVMMN